jgi:predicted acetyltransferase
MIKEITAKKEKEKYLNLLYYCFNMPEEHRDYILQLDKESRASGYFENKDLKAGIISLGFKYSLWGNTIPGTGIGGVATYPELRNTGVISKLLAHELTKQYENGILVSALYPFNFGFYNKFGYGSLGSYKFLSENPENINIKKIENGTFKPFTKKYEEEVYKIYNIWSSKYDFGIIRNIKEKTKIYETFKNNKIYNYVYTDSRNNVKGYIKYKLDNKGIHDKSMFIFYMIWKDETVFKDMMGYLYYHRDQISEIKWNFPKKINLELCFREPRIGLKTIFSCMGRPINIPELIKLKLKYINNIEDFVFSVNDNYIPENTGTYHVTGNNIVKKEFSGEKEIPLKDFSSMLFGSYTAEEMSLDLNYRFFNTKNNNIFITEFF